MIVDETIILQVQINGKLRARIEVAADASEDKIVRQELNSPEVQKHLRDKQIAAKNYAAGRLLNIVVK